jgi:GNAT superfamily N-acetyltransferase
MEFLLRKAQPEDIHALTALIDASVRGLQAGDYTAEQIDCALRTVYGVDTQLIEDGTYFAVEAAGTIVGCGGWSRRRTLYGGDQCAGREDSLLDPRTEAAKIRAFFVHPDQARRGIASIILEACESAALAEGFRRLEMGATLTGVPFYRMKGYEAVERVDVPLGSGSSMPIVRMAKTFEQARPAY